MCNTAHPHPPYAPESIETRSMIAEAAMASSEEEEEDGIDVV